MKRGIADGTMKYEDYKDQESIPRFVGVSGDVVVALDK
jgi:hypothetical protein